MLRIILLLSPVYVTLFWSITLMGNKKNHSTPRQFLSKFMLFPFISFLAHFAYFAPHPQLYYYLDLPYQYAGSLILPMFYIYFRLLTIDGKFSFRAHAPYLALPVVLATLYCIGAILTPRDEYRSWLFDAAAYPHSPTIRFLALMRNLQRIQFLVYLVLGTVGVHLLLRKFGSRAEQFYSDITDGKFVNVRILNYSIMILMVASFVAVTLGRHFMMSRDAIIYCYWSISTVILYFIGYTGLHQKAINPTFEPVGKAIELDQSQMELISPTARNNIIPRMLSLFEKDKIHLNTELNIMDIVGKVGTNRTYISSIINQKYNQNFCSFVNGYRIEELERILADHPDSTLEELAVQCGFGSVISLRRALRAKTGLSVSQWKNRLAGKQEIKGMREGIRQ